MADPISGTLLAVSAFTSVASGAVGYIGARHQAKQLDQQARQAQLLAMNQAQIERNNAVAAANDANYNRSVALYNRADATNQTQLQLRRKSQEARMRSASLEARGAKRGVFSHSFTDVLKSNMLLQERESLDLMYEGAQKQTQFSGEADLLKLRANRALREGAYQHDLTLAEGQNRSNSLRSQARSAKIGGIASLGSGIAQGAAFGTQSYQAFKKP